MFPIYEDTYERLGTPPDGGAIAERDRTIQQADDLRPSLDYLQSRNEIDREHLAHFAVRWGGTLGPVMSSLENRFRTAHLRCWRLQPRRRRSTAQSHSPVHVPHTKAYEIVCFSALPRADAQVVMQDEGRRDR